MDLTPYAGRWVALIDEQVVGIGATAVAAQQAASHNRSRERVRIYFVEPAGGEPLPFDPLLERLRPLLAQQNMPVYLVGGAVRDALLGRVSHDLDFVVPRNGIKLAFAIGDALHMPAYTLDSERDTGRVVVPGSGTTLDFARFRGADLTADLFDRDFTVNALALPATAKTQLSLIDPTGGLADLQAQTLRLPHANALTADPVRALRAVRLAHTLGFVLEPETQMLVKSAAHLLQTVSNERVREELTKILNTAVPHSALLQLFQLNLLSVILPEVAALDGIIQSPPHHEPVLEHTISVLSWLVRIETAVFDADATLQEVELQQVQHMLAPYVQQLHHYFARPIDGGVDGRLLLRLGAVLHDIGKRQTRTVDENGRIRFFGHEAVGADLAAVRLHQLTFSNTAVAHVKATVAGHMRPLLLVSEQRQPSRRAVYRYFRATGQAGLDICLLALADSLATHAGMGDKEEWMRLVDLVGALLEFYFGKYNEVIKPTPLLNGTDIIQILNLQPGPEVGRILRLIEEAQASGEIATRPEAILLAQQVRG